MNSAEVQERQKEALAIAEKNKAQIEEANRTIKQQQEGLSQEHLAPRNYGGRLGRDAASMAKKAVLKTPLRLLLSVEKQKTDDGQVTKSGIREVNYIANRARATYAAATTDELGIMLTERFAAIAIFNRGNAPRRDVIIVPPQS
jgi:phage-related tail fiber protein